MMWIYIILLLIVNYYQLIYRAWKEYLVASLRGRFLFLL